MLKKYNLTIIKLNQKITIGRKDKANFPELGLENIDIKIDTGAYTSAIHCHKVEKKNQDGKEVLVFKLLDPPHPQYQYQEFLAENYSEKRIKNSFGISEKRFVFKTSIILFGQKYAINLSLSERGEMKYPILIGRSFLIGKFVVDPARFDISYKQSTKKNKLKQTKTKK